MQTGVDGGRQERLEGTLLNSFRALGTGVSAATALVTADVQKMTETAGEVPAG